MKVLRIALSFLLVCLGLSAVAGLLWLCAQPLFWVAVFVFAYVAMFIGAWRGAYRLLAKLL